MSHGEPFSSTPRDEDTLFPRAIPYERWKVVDAACDQFEDEWHGGRRPRIETYLESAPDELREPLLGELLDLEMACLAASGMQIDALAYRRRFAAYPQVLDSRLGDSNSQATVPADRGSTRAIQYLEPSRDSGEIGRLGRYRVLRHVGSGAMGDVFQAHDEQLNRQVALKVMKPSLVADASAQARFLREARAMAAIDHEHVVRVYEVGSAANLPFLTMQYLQGETLQARLRGARLSPLEICRIGREAALGLAAAHQQGVVHRDIKPENLWLEENLGRVKILDFGLARDVSGNQKLTRTGALLGTLHYLSPEQAAGEPADHRSDLFSLGCILYEALTGQKPFTGSTPMAILSRITRGQPTPILSLVPAAPAELAEYVSRLMQPDPARRPQSADTVAKELLELQGRLGERGKASQARVSTPDLGVVDLPPAEPTITPLGFPRLWILAGICLLLLLLPLMVAFAAWFIKAR